MANISPIIREEEGNRLRAAYQRSKLTRRLTQTEVAAECGWKNASTFNRILNGKNPLTFETLTKLSQVLNVSPASISPRLAQEVDSLDVNRIQRLLPVSHVRSVTRGSWGEPFITSQRLSFYTADETAFALTFERDIAPAGLDGWVVIIEPSSKSFPGDRVIVRNGVGKYSFGTVAEANDKGALSVAIEGRGVMLSTPQRCMLIAALLPLSRLI
jgi:transcriptional regulator with XRE-family HTH domain